jgi:hypothetical protein
LNSIDVKGAKLELSQRWSRRLARYSVYAGVRLLVRLLPQ